MSSHAGVFDLVIGSSVRAPEHRPMETLARLAGTWRVETGR